MMALLGGYTEAHGTHGVTSRNEEKSGKLEIKATARTVREPVTLDLWQEHVDGRRPIGIIPIRADNTCIWGCIDIDKYDIDLPALAQRIRELKLPLVVCRTKSGGAHVFLFLESPAPAIEVQTVLRDLAARLGHGGSEIFPKQSAVLLDNGDLGNWLNMPYYGGDASDRYAIGSSGRGLTMRQFLTVAEGMLVPPANLPGLSVQRAVDSEYGDGPPCLQHLTTSGFPEGTRNNGLFAMGTFLKRKYPDRWEQMIEVVNQRHFNPPLPLPEVSQVVKSLRSREYRYKCSDMPLASHCNSGLCRTRKYGVGASGTVPVLGSLSKLDTDEPIWFLDVAGARIELSTDDLQNPTRFQTRCMESVNIVVPVLKRDTWQGILQGLFEDLTIIDAPPEASVRGQFFEHLESFCTDRQRAQTADEIILGKAWHDPETHRIYFRMRDVQEYLERVKFRGLTRTQMTSRVRKELRGGTHFFNLKGRGVNVFWVPEELFEVQTSSHDTPAIREEVL